MADLAAFRNPVAELVPSVSTAVSNRLAQLEIGQLPLSGMSVAALAQVYMRWEAKRPPASIQSLIDTSCWDGKYTQVEAGKAIEALFHAGLTSLSGHMGPGRAGDRREVLITPRGERWFEANCDYRRECNVVRYHSRFGTSVFEYDPRSPFRSRFRDPVLLGAFISGAALALLLTWLIR